MTDPEGAHYYAEAQAALGQAIQLFRGKLERIISTSNAVASGLGQTAIEANKLKADIDTEAGRVQASSGHAEIAHAGLLSPRIISPGHDDIQGAAGQLSTSVNRLGEANINLTTVGTFTELQAAKLGENKGELETDAAALSEFSQNVDTLRQASATLENDARPQF